MTKEERQQKKDDFVIYFEEVPVIKYASYYVEITEQTAHNWLKEDQDFFNRVNQAKSKWAKKRALKTKAEFQLERLDKEIWSERKELVVGIDPRKEILNKYLGDEDVGQASEAESRPPQDTA